MSKPKISIAVFNFIVDGEPVFVKFIFKQGKHCRAEVWRGKKAIRVDNLLGAYKARVTDAMRLIDHTSNGASPVYRGRQRASRAAKPGTVGNAIGKALRVFRGEP